MENSNEVHSENSNPKTLVEGRDAFITQETFIEEPGADPEDYFEEIKDNKEAKAIIAYVLFGEGGPMLSKELQVKQVQQFLSENKTGGEIAYKAAPFLKKVQETRPADRYEAYKKAEELLRSLR